METNDRNFHDKDKIKKRNRQKRFEKPLDKAHMVQPRTLGGIFSTSHTSLKHVNSIIIRNS